MARSPSSAPVPFFWEGFPQGLLKETTEEKTSWYPYSNLSNLEDLDAYP